jgi:hypothetical protein
LKERKEQDNAKNKRKAFHDNNFQLCVEEFTEKIAKTEVFLFNDVVNANNS